MTAREELLDQDPYQPRLEPGWGGSGVRLVCEHPACTTGGLFFDIDLAEHGTVTEALRVAASHVDEMHGD